MKQKRARFALVFGLLASVASAQDTGPLQTHLITPCRWLDTRIPGCVTGGKCVQGPFRDGRMRAYLVQGVAECSGGSLERPIPLGAQGLMLTVAAVEPTGPGFLAIYDPSTPRPLFASMTFGPGGSSSAVTVKLGPGDWLPGGPLPRDLGIYASIKDGGTVHLVVDIVGYLMP